MTEHSGTTGSPLLDPWVGGLTFINSYCGTKEFLKVPGVFLRVPLPGSHVTLWVLLSVCVDQVTTTTHQMMCQGLQTQSEEQHHSPFGCPPPQMNPCSSMHTSQAVAPALQAL